MLTRRNALTAVSLTVFGASAVPRTLPTAAGARFAGLPASFAKLEKSSSGRLGVAVLDTASGEMAGHRAEERFAMCSTFKMLLAAAVLQRAAAGQDDLQRTVAIPSKSLLPNSPVTTQHAGAQMTVRALCGAIVTRSDDTAANLLLATLGGPVGITQFARSLGDTVTRLDRTETTLNEARPGDPRDTTSPGAMLGNLRKLLLGNVLSTGARDQLRQWMIANQTGGDRLRAGLPLHWRVGDKTGSNAGNTTNDIAIVWPENQPPILIAAYLTECAGPETKRNAVLADVARLIASSLR
jgi:beta-lactamase class A